MATAQPLRRPIPVMPRCDGKRHASNAPASCQTLKISLSVTASIALTAVTTETIFSQGVVTAARAGLVTDRKIKRKRGEPLIWKYVCPSPRCLVVLEAEQLNRQNIKRANVSCAVEINHLPILY
jgi:hypothetical protein